MLIESKLVVNFDSKKFNMFSGRSMLKYEMLNVPFECPEKSNFLVDILLFLFDDSNSVAR